MLRIEDCRPGVEVIAIKNKSANGTTREDLSIGMIYSICRFTPDAWIYNKGPAGFPAIILNEVPISKDRIQWAYTLDQFKLRNKEEFTQLFALNNIPKHLYNEERETC